MDGSHSIHRVRVLVGSLPVALPWESREALVAHCLAAYPTTHPVVERVRAVGVSRPVELTGVNDRTFALAVIEAWAAQVGKGKFPPGINELRDALHDD